MTEHNLGHRTEYSLHDYIKITSMSVKALLIPIAAFAVSATGVSAFNSEVLENAGLSDDQISAFEEARELRKDGDRDAARDVLVEAGVDEDTLRDVKEAMREHRQETREAITAAVEDNDYEAFQEAIDGSPIADIVTTEDDFEKFVEAHELREDGEREEAREILEELGFEGKKRFGHGGQRGGFHGSKN